MVHFILFLKYYTWQANAQGVRFGFNSFQASLCCCLLFLDNTLLSHRANFISYNLLGHASGSFHPNHKDLAGFTNGDRSSCEILTQGVTKFSFRIAAYFLVLKKNSKMLTNCSFCFIYSIFH